MMKRRHSAQATGKSPEGTFPDKDVAKKFPRLAEYLAATLYDDGTRRETSTLSIFVEDGRLKVALNDRDEESSAYVTGDTLAGLLGALEEGLGDDSLDWRAWKGRKKK